MNKIRTEMFISTREISVVKRRRAFRRAFCEKCQRDVGLMSPSDAAFLIGLDQNRFHSLIEAGQIHVHYGRDEGPLVCLNSVCLA